MWGGGGVGVKTGKGKGRIGGLIENGFRFKIYEFVFT